MGGGPESPLPGIGLKILEISCGSKNDKHNKRHNYTLDGALQSMLEFIDESDYSGLSD